MDTTTFPAVIVPDVHISTEEMLMNPVNMHLGEDIRNPNEIIDKLIDHLKQKGADASWLSAVREFTHQEKKEWILSLPDPTGMLLSGDELIVPVTVYTTIMVKVAETLAGESLYEKKVIEKTLDKCLPG